MMWDNMFLWPFAALGMVVGTIILIVAIAFWILMIVDCINRKFRNDIEKVVWILVILLGSWFGMIIYYIVIRALNPKGLAKK